MFLKQIYHGDAKKLHSTSTVVVYSQQRKGSAIWTWNMNVSVLDDDCVGSKLFPTPMAFFI